MADTRLRKLLSVGLLEVRLTRGTVIVELDTSGTVDVAAERRRMEKDLAAAEKELTATTAKLDNDAFLAKAPPRSSTRSAAANRSPKKKSTGSRQAGTCNDGAVRPRTRSRRCSRWSTYWISVGRRPSSSRARPASPR